MSAIVDRFVMHRAISFALSSFALRLADALVNEQAKAEGEYIELRRKTGLHDIGDALTVAKTLAAIARALRAVADPKRGGV